MSGKTIGLSLNYGYAGNYARQPDMVIGSFTVDENSRTIMFGEPVYLTDNGTVVPFDGNGTPETFVGVASSEVKSVFDYHSMKGSYSPLQMASVMQRGAISVICSVGDPKVGGKVYIRIAENDSISDSVVGGFETEPDGVNSIEIKNCVWRTNKDSNSVAELLMRTINYV